MTVLEILREAATRLKGGGSFGFTDWSRCTCGHIYAAGVGHVDYTGGAFVQEPPPGSAYERAITAAARALGWTGPGHLDDDGDPLGAPDYVSLRTMQLSGAQQEALVSRDDAIMVIEQAIREIEAAEERARLDVLAQAAGIVDSVEPDPVLAR